MSPNIFEIVAMCRFAVFSSHTAIATLREALRRANKGVEGKRGEAGAECTFISLWHYVYFVFSHKLDVKTQL